MDAAVNIAGKLKKKSKEDIETKETTQVKEQSLKLAKAHNLSLMPSEDFERMAESLKPLKVTFQMTAIRSNDYKQGKEVFAYKVKMSGCTFIVDNNNEKKLI